MLCEAGGASRPGTDIVNCHHFDDDDEEEDYDHDHDDNHDDHKVR